MSTIEVVPLLSEADIARFWSKVEKSEGCWFWTGRLTPKGYGTFSFGRKPNAHRTQAHRLAYELVAGPIPQDLHIDHTCHTKDLSCVGGNSCRHRSCVRPSHLEAVTPQTNMERGRGGRKTHCVRGHLLNEENTRTRKDGHRDCRTCNKERCAAWYIRNGARLYPGFGTRKAMS